MTNKTLTSPEAVVGDIARLFPDDPVCSISVREDRAFSVSSHLSLGTIKLFPQEAEIDNYIAAVRSGAFEWSTPNVQAVTDELVGCLAVDKIDNQDSRLRAEDKIRRIIASIGAMPVRLGLSHPIFDPLALEDMPFQRATTVVSDTSGVVQGGLSFVSRYLHPAARIKVPAIVQMEIVNLADRFLRNRRAVKVRPVDMLMDHINSQAAQRVLLQLELRSNVELERTYLLGDPLRGAFQREEDRELRELNLSVPIRSYGDRLILEAARQHQAQVSVGHPVTLLTSDQGLARMGMAEGMRPLYFRAARAAGFFNKRLSGTNFHPFTGTLSVTTIPDVLWELATMFGNARLLNTKSGRSVVVHAIGDDLVWAPYHSHDDLLWVEVTNEPSDEHGGPVDNTEVPSVQDESAPRPARSRGAATVGSEQPRNGSDLRTARKAPLYKFSIDRLIRLIDRLETEQKLTIRDVMQTLGVRTESGATDYRRFLMSGTAVVVDEEKWAASQVLTPVAVALRNSDVDQLQRALLTFPSYVGLERSLGDSDLGTPVDAKAFGRASSTYFALAEVVQLGANIHGVGFFPTPTRSDDPGFARNALSAYDGLEKDSGWIATGKWLEELVVKYGIHPCVTRLRLQTASERGLIRRTTEGSTTETQYDRHTLKVLDVAGGIPLVKTEYLYRGDFLIPGKSSSSLKIEKVGQ